MVEIGAALTFNIHSGDNGGLIALLCGDPNEISNPDIMPSGSVDAQLVGGNGDDTISGIFNFNPRSLGQVSALVSDGAGNDNLRLDIFGIGDPDLVRALIDGGTGRNTAHATTNVEVINCEVVVRD
jgi:hypothetical protein